MNDDDPRNKPTSDKRGPAFISDDPVEVEPPHLRREPVFTDFEDDEDYEESERDTDYASAYEEDDDEGEDYLEPREDNSDEHAAAFESASGPELFEDEDLDKEDSDNDWDDQADYPDEPEELGYEPPGNSHSWPLSLVVVGIVALVLLAAGGYGVIQQRSAAEEDIRELRAALATAGNPVEFAANREALREIQQRNAENQATIDALTLNNQRLADMVAGLEKQLTTQQAAVPLTPNTKPAAPAPAATKVAPKPASPATAAATGDWFVNFSSYSQRSVAEGWVKKLKPSVGNAVVSPGKKAGKTFYRVRVVGLASRAQAEKVAGQLQSAYSLPPLWVGAE